MQCPQCKGSGKILKAIFLNAPPVDADCTFCEGTGLVEMPNDEIARR